jgi:hypothetical protein
MSDEDAYMALAHCNKQGELHPLEEGLHALGSGKSVRDYASRTGKSDKATQVRMQAVRFAAACSDIATADLRDSWSALSELHSAPRWLWRELVSRLVAEGWTVETARKSPY